MCQRVQCSSCGKPTFAGCGAHIEQVLADVPKADRCVCRDQKSDGDMRAAIEAPAWLKGFFGRL